ncbi:alkyl hydroperoxide reductase [Pedobacter sp. KBW06]|uniref:TlpA disulfide reductase family protein n=1 Tax=Pedobacter sp. KBW06 TaxID=2153359 RepID=UPI000F5931D9|nr:TlpA disulfide reductase family protein [Pedobacter sp. KBW06]RQO71996.1 alkyl hydroperoxide reductase [Pedobacter sp. KBW06]
MLVRNIKIILTTLLAIPFLGYSQNNDYLLTAKIGQLSAPAKAYLSYRLNGNNVLDSVVLDNGTFQFKGVVSDPIRASLILDHTGAGIKNKKKQDVLTIYLEKGRIQVNATDSIKKGVVSGPKINMEYLGYKASENYLGKVMAALNWEYEKATKEKRKDPEFQKDLEARYAKAEAERDVLLNKYIKANPDSFFSLVALKEISDSDMDVHVLEPVFNKLSTGLKNSNAGKEFAKSMEKARATSIGAIAMDFSQNDMNDRPVKLSDFRGKYLLLDFWASWCGPCRQENPNVVKAYKTYKDKNFTVLGVSLDQPGKKQDWLQAIEKDGLTWTQLSDLQGWKNAASTLYGVRGIPANFLIDPQGKIVGKDLRGAALEKKLGELLGK